MEEEGEIGVGDMGVGDMGMGKMGVGEGEGKESTS